MINGEIEKKTIF